MVARFAGASLGLFAFAITILAGLFVQNPVTVTLSRSILALFVFSLVGFVLGGAAQLVINEHEKTRVLEMRKRYREEPTGNAGSETADGSTDEETAPIDA